MARNRVGSGLAYRNRPIITGMALWKKPKWGVNCIGQSPRPAVGTGGLRFFFGLRGPDLFRRHNSLSFEHAIKLIHFQIFQCLDGA